MASRKDFDGSTNGTEVAEAFKEYITGRTIVITGVSPNSLGGKLATTIAQHQPRQLILASRSQSKLDEIVRQTKDASPSATIPQTVQLDLSSQDSVRQAATQIQTLAPSIDVLINNAAVVYSTRHTTSEGIEAQFGVGHIGHFLFTTLLLPSLLSTPSARVVNVSSAGHRLSPIRFSDYNFTGQTVPENERPPPDVPKRFLPRQGEGKEAEYSCFVAYGQSKTANVLFAVGLNKNFGDRGLKALSVHPGSIDTDLSRNLSSNDVKLVQSTSAKWITHDQGTATILVAALDPALDDHVNQQGTSGERKSIYLSDCQIAEAAGHATDPAIAERLWVLSERLTSGKGGAKM